MKAAIFLEHKIEQSTIDGDDRMKAHERWRKSDIYTE